ncbi:MAG: hypothetical protein KF845_09800 [Cyclobacteriaceae bacterium]|nr:hypothetical protein [Cyclobacteriaceae bacterium]
MARKEWKIVIGINLLIILLALSPFLPGPSLLSKPTNIVFNLIQQGSILGLLLIPIGIFWTIKQAVKNIDKKALPILLWTVPTLAFILSIWYSEPARNFSRTFAINNAGKLIEAIEKYKSLNKEYPKDITALTPTYLKSIPEPWVMGISGYDYKQKNDSYNLIFAQNVFMSFNFEVVIYNPTGEHEAEGESKTLYDAGRNNWKYYIYD